MHIEEVVLLASLALIKARALATKVVQENILATWEFTDWTLSQMVADRAAYNAQEVLAAVKDSNEAAARGTLNAAMDQLHYNTKIGVAGGKAHFHADPVNSARFARLLASEQDVEGRLTEALELKTAWENSDVTWKPTNALTLAAFQAEYAAAVALRDALVDAQDEASAASKVKNVLANGLWGNCVRWYEVATTIYAENTAIGADIRAQIPVSPAAQAPAQAVISVATSPAAGAVHLEYDAEHATSWDVLHKGPGDPAFTNVATDALVKVYDATGLPAGAHDYKVVGRNSKDDGPASAVSTVAVG